MLKICLSEKAFKRETKKAKGKVRVLLRTRKIKETTHGDFWGVIASRKGDVAKKKFDSLME